MKIAGAVALVTGGASGLGEATVAMVIEGGGQAAILDRPGSAGEDVARRLGAQALFAAADVTSAEEARRMPALLTRIETSPHVRAAFATSSLFVTSSRTGMMLSFVMLRGSRAAP